MNVTAFRTLGPWLIALIHFAGLANAAPAADVSAARSGPTDNVIARALQPFVDGHRLAGAVVLVADRNRTLDLEAVGMADIAGRKRIESDALFWIASQSKSITAAALMMLVDDGKVRLDDPVEKYLPAFAGVVVQADPKNGHATARRPGHPITVREILSHTSGLRFLNTKDKMLIDAVPLAESIEHALLEPLLFEPGTAYKYSNEGIDAAGLIIQVVSKMPYERFLQERLFAPLGMKDTTFFPSPAQVARLAKSYKPDSAKTGLEETRIRFLTYPLDGPRRYPAPGGGLFSTAADVARFCQMMLNRGVYRNHRCLSEAAVTEMTRKQTGDRVPNSYGLGLSVGPDTYGHGGAQSTNMSVDAKRGIVKVFMVQHAGFPGDAKQMHAALAKAVEQVIARPAGDR